MVLVRCGSTAAWSATAFEALESEDSESLGSRGIERLWAAAGAVEKSSSSGQPTPRSENPAPPSRAAPGPRPLTGVGPQQGEHVAVPRLLQREQHHVRPKHRPPAAAEAAVVAGAPLAREAARGLGEADPPVYQEGLDQGALRRGRRARLGPEDLWGVGRCVGGLGAACGSRACKGREPCIDCSISAGRKQC